MTARIVLPDIEARRREWDQFTFGPLRTCERCPAPTFATRKSDGAVLCPRCARLEGGRRERSGR